MKYQLFVWPTFIMVLTALSAMLFYSDGTLPIRPMIALLFLLFCPGMALVPLMDIQETYSELGLGIALSITLDMLVSGTMIYAHRWSPSDGMLVLIIISVAGAALQFLRLARRYHSAQQSELKGHVL